MQDNDFDVIVIGSGLAGVHASYPLVEAGLNVAMLDGGAISSLTLENDFPEDFEDTRRNHGDQHKLFLGNNFKNLVSDKESHVMSMTSGNRSYISEGTQAIPIVTNGVELIQTLAKGGLSEAWSAASDVFDKSELEAVGIPALDMRENYKEIVDRIGISGNMPGFDTMPGIKLDSHARKLLNKYKKMNPENSSLAVKPSVLALVTRPFKSREPLPHKDMEFFLNHGDSIYRARFTLKELEDMRNFSYIPECIVDLIDSDDSFKKVHSIDFTGKKRYFRSKYVVLAAGSLGSTRILLKSFGIKNTKMPFVTKNHFIIPTIELASLGKKDEKSKCSLTQLFITDKKKDAGMAKSFSQIISYKSLLLYKLMKFIPLPAPEAFSLVSLLAPSIVSVDVKFPSQESEDSYVYLDNDDILHVHAKNKNKSDYVNELKEIKTFLRKLGLLPLKIVENPFGSTAHYTGGVPFSGKTIFPLSANIDGKLDQDSNIYVADATTWRAQPAKPPGLTIMANANRIGKALLKNFKNNTY